MAAELSERSAPLPQEILGLVSTPGTLVAWGTDFPTGKRGEAAAVLWISSNGRDWRRVIFSPVGLRAGQKVDIRRVAAGPLGFVAIGAECCRPDQTQVWYSTDGETWVPGELKNQVGVRAAGDPQLLAVSSGSSEFVVSGRTPDGPAIWRSVDGVHWSQSGFEKPVESGEISDVRFTGKTFVAAGRIDAAGKHSAEWDPALWVSDDGTTWRRLGDKDPILSDSEDGQIQEIVPFAKGFWAFGLTGDHTTRMACALDEDCIWFDFAAWYSRDGQTWERLPPPLAPAGAQAGPRLEEYRVVDAAWDRLISVGEDSLGSPALWVAEDARTWVRIPSVNGLPDGASVNGIAVQGSELIAVGTQPNSISGDDGAVWIGHVQLDK